MNILDANSGKIIRKVDSCHEKNIHWISVPDPSVHVQLSSDCYKLFATSAIDNVISLWDIRTPRTVARYSSHVNKRENISSGSFYYFYYLYHY